MLLEKGDDSMQNWMLYAIGVFVGLVVVLVIVLSLGKKYRKEKMTKDNDKVEEKIEKDIANKNDEIVLKKQDNDKKDVKEKNKKKLNKTKIESTTKKPANKQKDNQKEQNAKKDNKNLEKSVDESQTYRIVYDKEQREWIVKIDGSKRASRRCKTKAEALEVAKELAKKKDADLSVHKKNGKFQKQK